MEPTEPPAGPPGPPQRPGDQSGQGQPSPQYGQGTPPPQYGAPQYGQPDPNQPQYGQPGPPQYGQPPYGYPGGQNQLPPQQQKTSVFAILSLVLGVISAIPFAIIFGIVALVRIPKTREKGKGMAIAGIVLACLWLVGIVLAVAFSDSDPERDASGQVTATADVAPEKLRVGDCVAEVQEGEVQDIKVQPCSQPNGGKVYAVFELPKGSFPGLDAVQASAETGCTDRWKQLREQATDLSDIFYLHPTEDSWSLGDHSVTCLLAPR
ncbi:DUF4190 domain-containing protein [Kribbella sp. NPDC051770]|uniref:DUF4190 domain-containing protein n=1 Tax=Kribbella sp. NPDC051770 TaxID=3155413 RepID=UPI003413010C